MNCISVLIVLTIYDSGDQFYRSSDTIISNEIENYSNVFDALNVGHYLYFKSGRDIGLNV